MEEAATAAVKKRPSLSLKNPQQGDRKIAARRQRQQKEAAISNSGGDSGGNSDDSCDDSDF